MIDFIDLPPFDIPEVLHNMVTPHGYEVEILPGGAIMGNGQRRSGIRVAVSWLSNRTGCHTSFEVEHTYGALPVADGVDRTIRVQRRSALHAVAPRLRHDGRVPHHLASAERCRHS